VKGKSVVCPVKTFYIGKQDGVWIIIEVDITVHLVSGQPVEGEKLPFHFVLAGYENG
jgi:hypothetical protein